MKSSLPPNFLFSGIDQEILKLDEELKALGGGDAELSSMELYAFINEVETSDYQVLWPHGSSIGLRDINQAKVNSMPRSMKYYNVKGSCFISEKNASNTDLANDITENLSHWVNNGFNGCLMNIGSLDSGKSYNLFGELGMPSFKLTNRSIYNTFSISILQSIFHASLISQSSIKTTIAISIWTLQDNKFVDLLSHIAETTDPFDFSLVECHDIHHTISLIHEARSRSPGCWANNDQHKFIEGRSECDFFIRITIIKRPVISSPLKFSSENLTETVNYLYLVDLVEYISIESKDFKILSDKEKIVCRNRNLQLSTLFQVIDEMNVVSRKAKASGLSILDQIKNLSNEKTIIGKTSARNSKLTTLLAPILQGNMKTIWNLYLNDGEKYYAETKHLISHICLVSEIISACYKSKDYSLPLLKYVNSVDFTPVTFDKIDQNQNFPFKSSPVNSPLESHNHSISSDYGDINLEEILNGNFENRSPKLAKAHLLEPVNILDDDDKRLCILPSRTPKISEFSPSFENQKTNNVSQIIGEFQSLLNSIQNKEFQYDFNQSISVPALDTPKKIEFLVDTPNSFGLSLQNKDFTKKISLVNEGIELSHNHKYESESNSQEVTLDSLQQEPIYGLDDSLESFVDFDTSKKQNIDDLTNSKFRDINAADPTRLLFPPQVTSSIELPKFKSRNYTIMDDNNKDLKNSFEKTDKLIFEIQEKNQFSKFNMSPNNQSRHSVDKNIVTQTSNTNIDDEVDHLIQNFEDEKNPHSLKDSAIPEKILDRLTAMQEIEKLQRIRNVLIEKLRQEKEKSKEYENQIELMNESIVEMKAQFELNIDSGKYQIHQLQSKLQKLCHTEDLGGIYSCFETDISRLVKENSMLREINLKLENKEFEHSFKPSTQEDIIRASNYSEQIHIKNQNRLYEKLKKYGIDYLKLKKEYEDLKSKERQFLLNDKIARDSNKRLKLSFQDLQRTKKDLEKESKLRMEYENHFRLLEEECIEFKKQNENFRNERSKLLAEVHMLRNQIYDLEQDKTRTIQMDKFVSKHSSKVVPNFNSPTHNDIKIKLTPTKHGNSKHTEIRKDNKDIDSLFLPQPIKQYPISTKQSEVKSSLYPPSTSGSPFNGLYLRKEESDSFPIEIESTLSVLHESILTSNPSLLPVLRKLSFEIHQERAKSIEQRSKLLDVLHTKTSTK